MRIVGDGALRAHVQRLAEGLDAPVDFLEPVAPTETGAHYAWADTILVSLRAWEPMKWTVPSKLFEVLATGRHVTGTLAGEPAKILTDSGAGHVVPPGDPDALADLWLALDRDRSLLDGGESGPRWVAAHAREEDLTARYYRLLQQFRESDIR